MNAFTTVSRENSLRQATENGVLSEKASSDSENTRLDIEAILPLNDDKKINRDEEPASLISFESVEIPLQTDIIRQPSPPPVLADVRDLIPPSHPVTEADHGMENSLPGGLVSSESPLQLHIVRISVCVTVCACVCMWACVFLFMFLFMFLLCLTCCPSFFW